jgi:hypothetical protein
MASCRGEIMNGREWDKSVLIRAIRGQVFLFFVVTKFLS